MHRNWILLAGSLALVLGQNNGDGADSAKADRQKRGEYLTHHVAMCIQCHSPHDDRGKVIDDRKFTGQHLQVSFKFDWPFEWAGRAPNIYGFSGYTEEEAIRLLTKGITREGIPPRPPMPPFRMSEEDARAVLAYLRGGIR